MMDFPNSKLCIRLASTYVEIMTGLPSGCGISEGTNFLESPYTVVDQSKCCSGSTLKSGKSVLKRMVACSNFLKCSPHFLPCQGAHVRSKHGKRTEYDSGLNIKRANANDPLEHANEGLVLLSSLCIK